jgi:hypothetical protein
MYCYRHLTKKRQKDEELMFDDVDERRKRRRRRKTKTKTKTKDENEDEDERRKRRSKKNRRREKKKIYIFQNKCVSSQNHRNKKRRGRHRSGYTYLLSAGRRQAGPAAFFHGRTQNSGKLPLTTENVLLTSKTNVKRKT